MLARLSNVNAQLLFVAKIPAAPPIAVRESKTTHLKLK
jgi:hypothetical protein